MLTHRSWQPKVTAVLDTRDITKLTTATFFGKLREHELEMTRLKEMETVEKKTRSLELKAKVADAEESSNEWIDIENLNLLTRRFKKFIKMKGKMKN